MARAAGRSARVQLAKSFSRPVDLFRSADSDKDGNLTRAELRRAIAASGIVAEAHEIQALFSNLDPRFAYR